jgi:hypothetical protein
MRIKKAIGPRVVRARRISQPKRKRKSNLKRLGPDAATADARIQAKGRI